MLFYVILFAIFTIHTCFILSNLFLFLVIHKATLNNTLTRNHLNGLNITNWIPNCIRKLDLFTGPLTICDLFTNMLTYAGSALRVVNNSHVWRVRVQTFCCCVISWYFLRATETILVIIHSFFSICMDETTIRLNLDKVKGTHKKYEMQ